MGNTEQPRLAVPLPEGTLTSSFDESMLWPIPILYEDQILIVDPITGQTYPEATALNCSNRDTNLFHLDMDRGDLWRRYSFEPGIVHQDKPAIFGPKQTSPLAAGSFTGSQDVVKYTRSESVGFWDNSLKIAALGAGLKIHFTEFDPSFYPRITIWWTALLHTAYWIFCSQNYIPKFFKNIFLDALGPFSYVFRHCGIYFSFFLFLGLIVDLIVMYLRHMDIIKITGASVGFGNIPLSTFYVLFTTFVPTSVFDTRVPSLAATEIIYVECFRNVEP